jgi:hypothetical protein
VRRSLAGFRFRWIGVERPGQVELRDRAGGGYELRGGVLVRAAAHAVTLPFGHTLRLQRGTWLLARNGIVLERFATAHVELDDTGAMLSVLPRARTAAIAIDLRTDTRRALQPGCRVGAQRGRVRFELCGYPYRRSQLSRIVRVDGRVRLQLVGPAERAPRGPAGSWERVALSRDGRYLLAQWSGECEIPTAYLIDLARTRLSRLGGAVESRALGWSGETALVALPRSACGSSAKRAGVYGFRVGGHGRLVYPLRDFPQQDVRLWR